MKTLFFSMAVIVAALFANCASRYRPIEPMTVKFDQPADTLAGGDIVVSWKYDVLKQAGNRKYARNERRYKVCLLAVRVSNFSGDTLLLPENLSVFSKKDSLEQLYWGDAWDELHQSSAGGNYQAADLGEFLFLLPFQIANKVVEQKANRRFSNELETFYLIPSYLAPGKTVVGLLALPVKKNEPLRFGLRDWKN